MGKLQKEQQELTGSEVFRTGAQKETAPEATDSINAPQIQRISINTGSTKESRKEEEKTDQIREGISEEIQTDQSASGESLQKSANKVYFERILENSNKKNLALKVRQDKLDKDNWKKVKQTKKNPFRQQLPTARKSGFWFFGYAEDWKVRKARRTFGNADICTVREQPALQDFLRSDAFRAGVVPASAQDEAFNPELKAFVDYLMNYPFSMGCLTDAYLADHIGEVYQYAWKLSGYESMKKKYPKFFASLPETQRISLDTMASTSRDLSKLIEDHLFMHGLEITDGEGGKTVTLRREPANRNERREERRILKEQYDDNLKKYLNKAFDKKDLRLAEQLVRNQFENEDNGLLRNLEEQFGEEKEVAGLFGPESRIAIGEIRKTLSVRKELTEELERTLEKAKDKQSPAGELEHNMRLLNDKIRLCSYHIDNYRQYLSFLNGDMDTVPKTLVEFLVKEDHKELLEPVKFRAEVECLNEALALSEYLEKKGERGKGGKDGKNAPKEPLPEYRVPAKLTRKEFFEKRRLLLESRDMAAEYAKMKKTWKDMVEPNDTMTKEEKEATIAARAKKYAEENHLKEQTINRYFAIFTDPKGEFLKGDSSFWIYVACKYQPTDKTPKKVSHEIFDKGIRPWMNFILETKPEDYNTFRIRENEDHTSKDYQERFAKILLGHDMASVLEVIRAYKHELSDEDFIRMKSYGRIMQGFAPEIRYLSDKAVIPVVRVISMDPKVIANSQQIYRILSDSWSSDPEAVRIRDKYSKETTGLNFKGEVKTAGKPTDAEDLSGYLEDLVSGVMVIKEYAYQEDVDLKKEYDGHMKAVRNEYRKDTQSGFVAEEKQHMEDAGFRNPADEQVKLRVRLKKDSDMQERLIGKNKIGDLKKEYGDTKDQQAVVSAFLLTLRRVEWDANGCPRADYVDNDFQNENDARDYIEGGERRRDYLKRKVKDIIAIDFEKILKPEYIDEHFSELLEINRLLKGFGTIAGYNADFFEGDGLTKEEKEQFRLKFTENPLLPVIEQIVELKAATVGLKGNGEELVKLQTDNMDELADMQALRQQQSMENLNGILETVMPEMLKQYAAFEKLQKENPGLISRISDFTEKVRIKAESYNSRRAQYEKARKPLSEQLKRLETQLEREKDEKRKAELKRQKDLANREITELYDTYKDVSGEPVPWDEHLLLAKEMREYFLGRKEKLGDRAMVFAEANGFADLLDMKEVDEAAFRLEKEKLTKLLGYPGAEKDEKEIRKLLELGENDDMEKAIEDMARRGVILQRTIPADETYLSEEQKEAFRAHFKNNGTGSGEDIRCFGLLCEPVRRDIFGKALPGYEENEKKNQKLLDDYLSGDKARMNSVLKLFADKVLKADLSPEKMTEEYYRKHTQERIETLHTLYNFQNYYSYKLEFFTGDAFTPEQQKELMKKMHDVTATSGILMADSWIEKDGYSPRNGRLQVPEKVKEGPERVNAFRNTLAGSQINRQLYKEEYRKALEREKTENSPERDEQLDRLNHLTVKAQKLGLGTKLYGRLQEIARSKKSGLDREERQELRAIIGAKKEITLSSSDRTIEDEDQNTIDDIKENMPWLNDADVRGLARIIKQIDSHTGRIMKSDRLLKELASGRGKGSLDSDEMREEIKAYTDRLVSLKFDRKTLNEEYLAEHADQVLEYIRAYRVLEEIDKLHPEILESLPILDQISIKDRRGYVDKVEAMFTRLLGRYGVYCKAFTSKGYGSVPVWEEFQILPRDEEKPSEEAVAKRKNDFNKAIIEVDRASAQKGKAGLLIAKELTQNAGSSEGGSYTALFSDFERIEESLQKNGKLYKACKPYYDRILEKYREDVAKAIKSVDDILYEMDDLNDDRPFLDEQLEWKEKDDPLYSEEELNRLKALIKEEEAKVEKAAVTSLKLHQELEKYQELFRFVSGEGGLLTKEAEDLLNEKGLSGEYGMILTNMVLENTKLNDYADPIEGAEERIRKAETGIEQRGGKAAEHEDTRIEYRDRDIGFHADNELQLQVRDYRERETVKTFLKEIPLPEFDESSLTDDYMAEHYGEIVEYISANRALETIREKSPSYENIFRSLPEEKQKQILKGQKYWKKVYDLGIAFEDKYGIGSTITSDKGKRCHVVFEKNRHKELLTKEKLAELQNNLDDAREALLKEVRADQEEEMKDRAKEASAISGGDTIAGETAEDSAFMKKEDQVTEAKGDTAAETEEGEKEQEAEEEAKKKAEEERKKREEEQRLERERIEEERRLEEAGREAERRRTEEERLRKQILERNIENEALRLGLPQYKVNVKRAGDFKYERMTTNNCWAVSGTAMFNQFNALNAKKGEKVRFYYQTDLRSYEPKLKSFEEVVQMGFEQTKKQYNADVDELKKYVGEGKKVVGNIFEVGDFFIEKRKDAVQNKIYIPCPPATSEDVKAEGEKLNKACAYLLSEVKKVLDTGNYVSLLSQRGDYGHYRTITGINGNKLRYLNPSDGDQEHEDDVTFFLKSGGSVELSWFTKLDKPEKMVERYKAQGLAYDEKKKTYSAPYNYQNVRYVGQTKGVLLAENDREYSQAMRSTYIPKQA